MSRTLSRVAHDGGGIRFEIADVAVGLADENRGVLGGRIVLEIDSGVIGSAVVGPRDVFVVECIADGTDFRGGNGAAGGDAIGIHRAVGKKPGGIVVDHVVVALLAIGARMPGKRREIVADCINAGLRGIGALGEVAIEVEVHGVNVLGALQWVRVGNVRRRNSGIAVRVGPKDGVAGTEHEVVGASAAHEGLVEIVAHGVLVGELLEERGVPCLDVVEGHGVAAAVVVNLVAVGWVGDVGVGGDDIGIEVAEAARGVVARGVFDAAIGLLPHLIEPVSGVARVGIVGKFRACERERPVRKRIEVLDAGVRVGLDEGLREAGSCAGGQKVLIREFQGGLNQSKKSIWRAWREDSGRGCEIQSWLRENFVGRFFIVVKADVVMGAEGRDGLELLRLLEIGTGGTVCLDDAFGQEVRDCGVFLRDVGRENVIKSAVFTDEDNDMLNRRFGFWCLLFDGILRRLRNSGQGIEKNGGEAYGGFCALPQKP